MLTAAPNEVRREHSMNQSLTQNGVEEIRLDSWSGFFQLTTERFATGPAYIYRGQANYDWKLLSRLDRLESRYPKRKNLGRGVPDFFDRPPFTEEQHLSAFKRAIRGRRGPNPPPLTEDDYWALGQHHGLATPLLDWTRSPFIALFFAFEQDHWELMKKNSNLNLMRVLMKRLFVKFLRTKMNQNGCCKKD